MSWIHPRGVRRLTGNLAMVALLLTGCTNKPEPATPAAGSPSDEALAEGTSVVTLSIPGMT